VRRTIYGYLTYLIYAKYTEKIFKKTFETKKNVNIKMRFIFHKIVPVNAIFAKTRSRTLWLSSLFVAGTHLESFQDFSSSLLPGIIRAGPSDSRYKYPKDGIEAGAAT
jgi:hypothetical protein